MHFVGNIMAESVVRHLPAARSRHAATARGMEPGGFLLATVHRPENADRPEVLAEVAAALAASPLPVLFPVHPRTSKALRASGLGARKGNVVTIDPVGYLEMLSLECDAAAIVTDSGGVQEESCVVRTPCVTVRHNTERTVTLEVGANRLVGAERGKILAGVDEALASSRDWPLPERWDDRVSARVVEALAEGVVPLAGC